MAIFPILTIFFIVYFLWENTTEKFNQRPPDNTDKPIQAPFYTNIYLYDLLQPRPIPK